MSPASLPERGLSTKAGFNPGTDVRDHCNPHPRPDPRRPPSCARLTRSRGPGCIAPRPGCRVGGQYPASPVPAVRGASHPRSNPAPWDRRAGGFASARRGGQPKSSRKESGLQELAAGIHGQIPRQEHPVADGTENRWRLGHRVPNGFGVVGSEAKNGCAVIRGGLAPGTAVPSHPSMATASPHGASGPIAPGGSMRPGRRSGDRRPDRPALDPDRA